MMTCAAMGLLLRISYELDRARRQRGERTESTRVDASGFTHVTPARMTSAQQAARLGNRSRIEPTAGAPV
jgi:cell division protein FtsW